MNMETLLAVLLLISSLLHIYRSACNYIERHKNILEEMDKEEPVVSIPTAADAKFLRMQIRNPSWTKVYKAINAAIAKGEDHCEFWFYEHSGEAKIPYKELQDELGALGYRVEREVLDSCFSVWWG